MADIINLMIERGYPIDEEGVCRGIALMAERARQRGKYHEFQERMNFFAKLKNGVLNALINRAQNQAKNNPAKLTTTQKLLLSIDPFFYKLSLYQKPDTILKFLELNGSAISQGQFSRVEELTQEEDPLPKPHTFLLSSLANTNTQFIREFLENIKNSAESIGLVISSPDHAIHLFYDKEKNKWILTNHSQREMFDSLDDLIYPLLNIFSNNETQHLAIDVFTNSNSLNDKLSTRLKKIEKQSLENLLSKNPNAVDSSNYSLLYLASKHGNIEIVKDLLNHQDIAIDTGDPLMVATIRGHVDVVKALLDKKSDPSATNNEGISPLLLAAQYGHKDIVEILLAHLNKDQKNLKLNNYSIMDIAVKNGDLNLVNALLKDTDIEYGEYTIEKAVKSGHWEIVKALLDKNDNYNTIDLNNLLFLAAENGHTKIIELLLQEKYSVNLKHTDNDGNTLLYVAAKNGHHEVVKFLAGKVDASVLNQANEENETALSIAVSKGHLKVVEALLKVKGINVHTVDRRKVTPLKVAANLRKWDIVHALTSSIISQDIKRMLFTYLSSHVELTGHINIEKSLFFRDIEDLLSKDILSIDTLIVTLKKYNAKDLFSGKNRINSKATELVVSLFAELGYSLNELEIYNIVEGKISNIEEDLKSKARHRIINKWKSNPYHSSTRKYLEHEINILLGLNITQNRGLSPATALFNKYNIELNITELMDKICLVQDNFPDYLPELLFDLSHQFEGDPKYIKGMTDFVCSDQPDTKKNLQLAIMNSHPSIAKAAILYEASPDDEKPTKPRDFFEIDSALQPKVVDLLLKEKEISLIKIQTSAENQLQSKEMKEHLISNKTTALSVIQNYLNTLPKTHVKRSFFENLKQAIESNGLNLELLQMHLNQVNHDMLFKKTFGQNSESKALQCVAELYKLATNKKLDISNFLRTKTLPKKHLRTIDNLEFIVNHISKVKSEEKKSAEEEKAVETPSTNTKENKIHALLIQDKTKSIINEMHAINREKIIKGQVHNLSFLPYMISDKHRISSEEKMMYEIGLLNHCYKYAAGFPPAMRKRIFDDYQSICTDYVNFLVGKKYVPFNHTSQGMHVYKKIQTLKKLLLQETNAIKSYSSDSLEELVYKVLIKIMASEKCHDPKYYLLVQSLSVFLDNNDSKIAPNDKSEILRNVKNLKMLRDIDMLNDNDFVNTLKHFIDGKRSVTSLQEALMAPGCAANDSEYANARLFKLVPPTQTDSKPQNKTPLIRRASLPNLSGKNET